MSTPTKDDILAIYKREKAREAREVAAGRMSETTHRSVLAATRTHVHYQLRLVSPSTEMIVAWQQTDALVRAAGIWDEPPVGDGGVAVSTISEKRKKVA
jgi:hypothetical protein